MSYVFREYLYISIEYYINHIPVQLKYYFCYRIIPFLSDFRLWYCIGLFPDLNILINFNFDW